MRKRTVKNLFDNIMWYTIYLLPILVGLIAALSLCGGDWYGAWLGVDGDMTYTPSTDFFNGTVRSISNEFMFDSVYESLLNVLNLIGMSTGAADDSAIFMYLCYFVTVYIAHLFVDFVLFIPRLCHKWMNAFTNAE